MRVSNLSWQRLDGNTQFLYTTKEEAARFDAKRLLGLKKIRINAFPLEDTDCMIDLAKAEVLKVVLNRDAMEMAYYYTIYLK